MGVWSTIKTKAQEYNQRFQAFKDRHPKFKFGWNFLTHITMLRVYAIVGGIAAAPFTGGFSLIFAAKVGFTFGASLISIAAKAIQMHKFKRLKLRRGLTNAIAEKHAILDRLRYEKGKERKRLFKVIESLDKNQVQSQLPYPVNAKPPSRIRSFFKTLVGFGTENIAPAAMMFFTTGPVGLIGYVGALAFGVRFISSEFVERNRINYQSAHVKDTINGACKIANIPPYKNLKELHTVFKDRMVKCEVAERMCKIFDGNPKMSENDIKRIYKEVENEVRERVKFENIPPNPNFLKSFWHEVRPWGEKPVSEYIIPVDKIISYKKPKFSPVIHQNENIKQSKHIQREKMRRKSTYNRTLK